jgi:TraY domain
MGRPTRPPKPGERVTMGLRVSAEMKRRLEKDAVKAGRSLSQEAEIRLEQSYDRQWILEYLTKLLGKSEE